MQLADTMSVHLRWAQNMLSWHVKGVLMASLMMYDVPDM